MFCTKCGQRVALDATACASCGSPVAVTTDTDPVADAINAVGEVPRYAGFWRRVAASMIDALILFAVMLAVGIAQFPTGADEESPLVMVQLASLVGGWLYTAVMHSSSWQATFGKRALGIKVTGLDGERIGFGRATGRHFATWLSSLILGIGFLMVAFTKQRQALHDKVAGTLVVSREATAAEVVSGLAPPKVSRGVLMLAILAGLVPIAGVVAAIATPAYQDYLTRSQVIEGLVEAQRYQAAVAAAVADGTDFGDIHSESLQLATQASGPYVDAIEVEQGVVFITYGKGANDSLADQTLALIPGLDDAQQVVWICGLAHVPDGVTPAIGAHAQYTSVHRKYLPSTCRGGGGTPD